MNCSGFRELLDNYEGLDEIQLNELEKHTEQCAECRRELEFFKSIIQTTASIPMVDPPKDLLDRINERIDSESASAHTVSRIVYGIRDNARRYASIAACLMVGLAVGVNSEYIKDRLTDNKDGGVISTTVHDTKESSTDEPGTAVPAETEASDEVRSETTKKPAKKKKPVSSFKPKVNAIPAKTAAPSRQNTPTVIPKPAVEAKATEAAIPAVTEAAASATEQATPNVTVRSLGNYKIVQSYTLPQEETAAAETEAPTEITDVESYALRTESYQIATSNYSTQVNSVSPEQTISDKIIIGAADAETVSGFMSRLGITYNNGYYMTSMNKFYELLMLMDEAGIAHDYVQQYSTDAKITFKLILRQ